MNHSIKPAFLLAFSLLMLSGCTSQDKSHNRYRQSTKRYRRDCGCFIYQPNHTEIALNTFANGK